jgi:hypothetical protein
MNDASSTLLIDMSYGTVSKILDPEIIELQEQVAELLKDKTTMLTTLVEMEKRIVHLENEGLGLGEK